MVKKFAFVLALGFFILSICSKIIAVGNNTGFGRDGPYFTHKESTYKADHWFTKQTREYYDREKEKTIKYPVISRPFLSEKDFLAFIVVKITTKKIDALNDEEDTLYDEVGTGFLTLSSYKSNAILEVAPPIGEEPQKREPLLVTTQHCVREWSNVRIKALEFDIHYIDSKKKKFYLVTVHLPNKNYPVKLEDNNPNVLEFWAIEENIEEFKDIAILRLGEILQKGKDYLDKTLNSKHNPFFKAVDLTNNELTPGEHRSIGYLSDVVMYGYPFELSASNSLPLARFGHCSTDPKQSICKSFDSKEYSYPQFYVDMGSIGGSSGSPVWFYFRKFEGQISNTDVTVNDNGDASLDSDLVEISEEECHFVFAGMFFEGPEGPEKPERNNDIHLGIVLNKEGILSFLNTLKESSGPRNISGWKLEDVDDDGNCLFRAFAHQLQHQIEHSFVTISPYDRPLHERLRIVAQQDDYQDRAWAGHTEIISLAGYFEVIVAIVDTRHPENGFVYHYINREGNADFIREIATIGEENIRRRPVVRLAFTGNHYLSVVSTSSELSSSSNHLLVRNPNVDIVPQATNETANKGGAEDAGKNEVPPAVPYAETGIHSSVPVSAENTHQNPRGNAARTSISNQISQIVRFPGNEGVKSLQ